MLGHGVNLPCETLLFAETTKFDGEARRDLLPWELAQIAGRAGRFGLVERGHVGTLTGIPWANADPALVEAALQPHVVLPSGHLGYRVVDEARIRPRLSDLGTDDPRRLDAALAAWHRVATREWAYEGWLAVESLDADPGRLAAIQRRLGERNRRLGLEDTWKLINAPVDEDDAELLATLALALAGDTAQRSLLTFLLDPARLRDSTLAEAEQAGRTASILRWFALQYPGVGGVTIERAAALEETAAERVVARLRVEVNAPDDRPLPHVRPGVRAVVPALRPLLRAALRIGDTGGVQRVNLEQLDITYDDGDPEGTPPGTRGSAVDRRLGARRHGLRSCRRARASAPTTTSTGGRVAHRAWAARHCGIPTARTCSGRSRRVLPGRPRAHKVTNTGSETVRVSLRSCRTSRSIRIANGVFTGGGGARPRCARSPGTASSGIRLTAAHRRPPLQSAGAQGARNEADRGEPPLAARLRAARPPRGGARADGTEVKALRGARPARPGVRRRA